MPEQDPEVVGLGYTNDDVPLVVIEATMVENRGQFLGSFDIRFNAALIEGDVPAVVFTDRSGATIGSFAYDDEMDDWLTTILDGEAYHSAINYDVIPREDLFGGVAFPVLGRDVGARFDHAERHDLDPELLSQFEDIRNALRAVDTDE